MAERDMETERRVHELRVFARETAVVPILVQRDPDPDGMASALGIRTVLRRSESECPIVSLGEVTRPENRRMAELLNLKVTRVTESELNAFERVVAVDTQPETAASRTRFAIIDHHPPRPGYTADLVDIRPWIGAASTIVTEYLRADGEGRVTPRLATALLYGIRTDTDVLRRGTSPADVHAYAFLQQHADDELVRTIGRPAFSTVAMTAVGRALAALRAEGDVAVAWVGSLNERDAHVLPNLADFLLAIEGVSWSAAGAIQGDEVAVNIRKSGGELGAGDLARALAEEEGKGGGHHSMARVAFPMDRRSPPSSEPGDARSTDALFGRVVAGVEGLRAVR